MGGTLIIEPVAIASAVPNAGTGAANLLTQDPKEVWSSGAVTSIAIAIDLGVAQEIDSLFLGFTNVGTTADISIYRDLPNYTTPIVSNAAFRAADSLGPRHHCFIRFAAVTARYFSLDVTGLAGTGMEAGVLILGKAFERPREAGPGRLPIDMGARLPLRSGGFGIGRGAIKAGFQMSFVDMGEAELQQLWSIVHRRGETAPVVLVEDPDLAIGRNEAIHYGLFDRLDRFERQDPTKTRWSLSMVEWT